MRRIIEVLGFGALLVVAGCVSMSAKPDRDVVMVVNDMGDAEGAADLQKVFDALEMVQAGRIEAAVDGPLAEVIDKYEARYADRQGRVFSAEGVGDALVYAALSLNEVGHGAGTTDEKIEVLGPAWAKAYWVRGYAYGEMGRYVDARAELEKAVALAPMNSQYLSELAFTYVRSQDWGTMLSLYKKAENAVGISADGDAVDDLSCVALRGQGYALVEMMRLDEAEAAYRACLKLKPDEPKSLGELGYIEELRKRPF